jgi:hypothetical protein
MPTLSGYDQKDYSSGYKKRTYKAKSKPVKKPGYDRRAAKAKREGREFTPSVGYDRKAAAERRKNGTSLQAAAERRTKKFPTSSDYHYTIKQYKKKNREGRSDTGVDNNMKNYREDMANRGNYRGKYYGPDEFKGNLSMLDKWRKSGSPKNVKGFAKKNRSTRSAERGD